MLIDYPALMSYHDRYESLAGVPLMVTAHLLPGSRAAGYDPINLDNLLARAVVMDATQFGGLPSTRDAYRLPVPLRCLWRDDDGLPLWAATVFHPMGATVTDVAYWHKRAQPGRFTGTPSGNFAIRSTNGRWMERRVPLPTTVAGAWEADAIGDPGEILRLLAILPAIGKRRGAGFGEVLRWEVSPLDEFCLVRDGRLTRPMPAHGVHLLGGVQPSEPPAPVGWTPPQWKPDLFRPGWWSGTPVSVALEGLEETA